jgi:hypothetical protein
MGKNIHKKLNLFLNLNRNVTDAFHHYYFFHYLCLYVYSFKYVITCFTFFKSI